MIRRLTRLGIDHTKNPGPFRAILNFPFFCSLGCRRVNRRRNCAFCAFGHWSRHRHVAPSNGHQRSYDQKKTWKMVWNLLVQVFFVKLKLAAGRKRRNTAFVPRRLTLPWPAKSWPCWHWPHRCTTCTNGTMRCSYWQVVFSSGFAIDCNAWWLGWTSRAMPSLPTTLDASVRWRHWCATHCSRICCKRSR